MVGAQVSVGERERVVDVVRLGEARVFERGDAIELDLVTDERGLRDKRARRQQQHDGDGGDRDQIEEA